MINKKEYILMIIIISILTYVSTVNAEKTFTNLDLTVQCSNSTYANISYIKYVSDSYYLISSDSIMTKSGNKYNYTITSDLNNRSGEIEYGYHCDVNGIDTSAGNTITINLFGEKLTQAQGTLYIIIFIGVLIILLITLWGAIAFPWKNSRDEDGYIVNINDLKYVKVVLWVFVYLEFLFLINTLRNLTGGFLLSDGTYSFFNLIYNFLLIGMIPFFPLLIFFTIVIWLSDKKTQKNLIRGLPVR